MEEYGEVSTRMEKELKRIRSGEDLRILIKTAESHHIRRKQDLMRTTTAEFQSLRMYGSEILLLIKTEQHG